MAPELASAYSAVICGVPHCYPVTGDEFACGVSTTAAEAHSDAPLRAQAAFVATEGAAPVGFIDAAIGRPEGARDAEHGVVRFFWYPPGRRTVGQELLDTAENYLRSHGMAHVQAFPQEYRYRFYHLEAAHLSEHLGAVHALLAFNGYQRARGEVFLDWRDYEPVEPPAPGVAAQTAIEWRPGQGTRPNLVVKASSGGAQIGICRCMSAGEFTRNADAQDWLFTEWLGVEDEVQGRGLGRFLLRRALLEAHQAGYRHAAISTAWDNFRAFLFYTNFGYRVVDWTYGFLKSLRREEASG
jgi:GNAT superfamily N-acetyltransferase